LWYLHVPVDSRLKFKAKYGTAAEREEILYILFNRDSYHVFA
jgi:hypothetical protein